MKSAELDPLRNNYESAMLVHDNLGAIGEESHY